MPNPPYKIYNSLNSHRCIQQLGWSYATKTPGYAF